MRVWGAIPTAHAPAHHAHTHAIGAGAKSGIRRDSDSQVHSRPSAQPLAGSHGSPGDGEAEGGGGDGEADGGGGGGEAGWHSEPHE